jgi:hypothetical protein
VLQSVSKLSGHTPDFAPANGLKKGFAVRWRNRVNGLLPLQRFEPTFEKFCAEIESLDRDRPKCQAGKHLLKHGDRLE